MNSAVTTLSAMLAATAAEHPDRIALKLKDATLTYAQWRRASDAFAGELVRHGVHGRSRVILALENSFEYAVAFFAVLSLGATVVPLNPDTSAERLRDVAFDCEAALLIARRRVAERLEMPTVSFPSPIFVLSNSFAENRDIMSGAGPVSAAAAPSELALVLYTSGTTGKPKGVMLTHANLLANTRSIVEFLKLTANDSIVTVLPFFYSFGNSVLLTHAAVGGRIVIENGFAFPAKVVEIMQRERPSGFSGVPSTYYILLHKTNFAERHWSFLRYISQAGGGMRPEVVHRLRALLPNTKVVVMYGQTEGSARLAYLPPADLERKLGSIGKAIPGVEIRVVNERGEETAVDEPGEILARGANIMAGYLNQPEATAQAIRNGWLHTGDIARRDTEGFLYVLSRKSDFIKTGSYRVSPAEIENVIAELPGIEDVAVIGTEDELLGEALVACVSSNGSAFNADQLRAHCLQRLPFYKVPKYFIHEPVLPRTESGKKKYAELRAKYRGLAASAGAGA